MVLLLSVIGVIAAFIILCLKIKETIDIFRAEKRMLDLIKLNFQQEELQRFRDKLSLMQSAEIAITDLNQFYEIHKKISLVTGNLDLKERRLINEGLEQSSKTGKINYMLKLLNNSIAN